MDISLHAHSISGHIHPRYKPRRTRRCAPRRGSCPSPTVPLVWVALNPRATTANTPAILSIFSVEIQPREREGTIFFFLFPSPFRPLPLIQRLGSSPLLFEQSVETVHWYVGQDRQRGAEEEHRGAREAPRRTVTARAAPLVVWTVEAATKVVSETGPESSAPRDQTERRHREDGFSRFFFSLALSLSLSSTPPPTTFYLSLPLTHTHTRARASSALHSPPLISYL